MLPIFINRKKLDNGRHDSEKNGQNTYTEESKVTIVFIVKSKEKTEETPTTTSKIQLDSIEISFMKNNATMTQMRKQWTQDNIIDTQSTEKTK